MRIIQLSDIHLSSTNLEELKNSYMEALLTDLKVFNQEKSIDVILLTGDLLDKGGDSLSSDAYQIFQNEFINPIIKELNISKDKVIFIPGNHDINRELIEKDNEYFLSNTLTKETADETIKNLRNTFDRTNKRIEKFKLFEKNFHNGNSDYVYSNNESLTIVSDGEYKIGFALVNDSWRCSNNLKKDQHFIGVNQLFNAKKYFLKYETDLNIAVFHHPLESINSSESEDIENILKSLNFDIAIFGHSHAHKFEKLISTNGGYISINGRAALNNVHEKESKFQPGYNIIDIDIKLQQYILYARKYISSGFRFDKDVESLKNGEYLGKIEKTNYYNLNTDSNNLDAELPNGYSADVNRIVKLLIGKSLYPNPYIFVRELIQNSVDACNRVKEKNTNLNPQIIVNINTEENYFEVSDDGDGMSKKILKDHFSVIGKSISQEFNDSNGNFNLISQFGIGFISTFIVAQKVYISTKNESDELITFEITDVFKGFNYDLSKDSVQKTRTKSGTTVRVHLKQEFSSAMLFGLARSYCRHLDNVEFHLNSTLQTYNESWNTENGIFEFVQKNTKHEVKLVISPIPRQIIASNCGFLISNYSPPIVPFRFPFFIGGEVNFTPKSIDFDLSRSNIIETEKSKEFRKDISVSLRVLFRQVLESNNQQLTPIVLNYLQYYLCLYENNQRSISESYTDFYSKKELMMLCEEYLSFDYKNWNRKLSYILSELNSKGIRTIYISNNSQFNDFQNILIKYLSDKGNFIFTPKPFTALFRDTQQPLNTLQVIQIIAQQYGIGVVNLESISSAETKDMKMDLTDLYPRIASILSSLEATHNITINVAGFNKASKPMIRFQNEYFINFEHDSFQSLLANLDNLDNETTSIYLQGLLGVKIISTPI